MTRMPGRMPVGRGRASAPIWHQVMEVPRSLMRQVCQYVPLSTHIAALETALRFEREERRTGRG